MSEINVLYYSCPYDLSGYGSVSRNHLVRLNDYEDIKIRLKTKKFWTGISPDIGEDKTILQSMERTPLNEDNFIFIEHLTPENFYIDPRARYHIAYTPFETDGAPLPWLLPLRAVDEVWVPSTNNKDAYARSGIDPKKIKVIPHGVDIEKYKPEVKPLAYNRGEFNFGSVFDWTERKNPVALIKSFYNAFCNGENVTLTIRTFWRFPVEKTKEYVLNEIAKIKHSYGDRKDFPKIMFWFDTVDEGAMPSLYKSFDCFVLPSRGEGFGLPFLEAMACGVPAIGPSMGGNMEFMNENNSVLVGGHMIPIEDYRFLKLQPQYNGQGWFDINEEELAKSMRWVYDNREKAAALADNAVADIQKNWTWHNTAKKINDRLVELNNLLSST